MKDDINSLSHSKWRCKYHIVFAPKYRRKEIYGDIRKDIGVILRKLCEQKNVEIIEAELCPNHIHIWCRGYYVDTVGKNEKKIAEYIREQLQSDIMEDQISLKEFVDPFTGKKNK